MIKTYDIDLDDTLVDGASKIFENLGTDIDSAIKIFLKQAILRKGFPFDVTIPEKVESEAAVGGMISAESGACAETVDSVAESEGFSYGSSSHSEGILTTAGGDASHAEGTLTYTKGNYSHAEGYQHFHAYGAPHGRNDDYKPS